MSPIKEENFFEVPDSDGEDQFTDCESDEDAVPLKFKQSVLKNKGYF